MTIDFVDVSRTFCQSEAIREVHVQLSAEESAPKMYRHLKKSVYGVRDAPQNWGQPFTDFKRSVGLKSGQSSP